MRKDASKRSLRPLNIRNVPFLHLPMPEARQSFGSHPSNRRGVGNEIEHVRKLEPGDDRRFYSPSISAQKSAESGKREEWAVFFRKTQESQISVIVDCSPDIDFPNPDEFPDTYDVISKRHVALRIAATLGHIAVHTPNDGAVFFSGVGNRRIASQASDEAGIHSALGQLDILQTRESGALSLVHQISAVTSDMTENLIFIISDFLFLISDEESWRKLASAVRRARLAAHDVVLIRIADMLEQTLMGGGAVEVGTKQSKWSSSSAIRQTKHMEERNKEIDGRIKAMSFRPRSNFLKLIWSSEKETTDTLKKFLMQRAGALQNRMTSV